MSKNLFTGTATQPQHNRKFCQFNNDQYCISILCERVVLSSFTFKGQKTQLNAHCQKTYNLFKIQRSTIFHQRFREIFDRLPKTSASSHQNRGSHGTTSFGNTRTNLVTVQINPFNPVARCRESMLFFSNNADPDQRAPTGALWSGSELFENVNIFFAISHQFCKIYPNSKFGMVYSAIFEWSIILFRGERIKVL